MSDATATATAALSQARDSIDQAAEALGIQLEAPSNDEMNAAIRDAAAAKAA